jgi:quercetin dioxygenase-like cupin family protein
MAQAQAQVQAQVQAQAEEGVLSGNGTYRVQRREMVAETPDLRMVILTLAAGHAVPWHTHTNVTDTFICLEGPLVVETREPEQRFELSAGQMCAVPAQRPHTVHGKDGGPCRFANLQGVGHYDFKPLPKE